MKQHITSLYGLTVGDMVEWDEDGRTMRGEMIGFGYGTRSPVVRTRTQHLKIFANPRKLRVWQPPRTPEEIEAFLAEPQEE